MNTDLYKKVHAKTNSVHVYTEDGRELPIKEQRGRLYVNYCGKQINLKDIAERGDDYVFNYIFNGGIRNYPCPAMDYWIYRHRLKNRISTRDYAKKFGVAKK